MCVHVCVCVRLCVCVCVFLRMCMRVYVYGVSSSLKRLHNGSLSKQHFCLGEWVTKSQCPLRWFALSMFVAGEQNQIALLVKARYRPTDRVPCLFVSARRSITLLKALPTISRRHQIMRPRNKASKRTELMACRITMQKYDRIRNCDIFKSARKSCKIASYVTAWEYSGNVNRT